MAERIAVFAGTLVDTQMGADVLAAHGIDHIQYPVSRIPREQHKFQISSADEKRTIMRSMLKKAMSDGCDAALIYCNSLSGSLSFPELSKELSLKIVTPFDAYRNLAKKYSRIAAIAFNPIALSGVELAMSNAVSGPAAIGALCGSKPSLIVNHGVGDLLCINLF